MTPQTAQNTHLHFHEEILLLALREEDGKIEGKAGITYKILMAAAILAELVLLERIVIEDTKTLTVSVLSSRKVGNAILDARLNQIVSAKKETGAQKWVHKIANCANLEKDTANSLCEKKILSQKSGKVFFFFDKTYYPELDPRPENEIKKRLERAIFTDSTDIDERTLILLSLLRKSDLLKVPFDAKALKKRKHRMKEITEGRLISQAAQKAAEAVETAIVLAAAMPAIVTVVT